MQLYKHSHWILFLLIISVFSISQVRAQDANTMYYMRGVPQVYQTNPAIQPDCNFFLGLPGLAPLKIQARNSFGLTDVLQYDSSIDSLITFLHPNWEGPDLLDVLKESNLISTEFSTSLASFGFRRNNTFISYDIRERMSLNMNYSRDFVRFPIEGPTDGNIYDLNLGIDMSLFNEWSMAISQKFGDRLTIGVRGKLLFGQANLNTESLNIHLESGIDQYNVQNDISIKTSSPYLTDYVEFATAAPIATIADDIENFDVPEPDVDEIMKMAINPENFGLAMDVGVDFRLYDWLQLNASVVDFGSIKWKSGTVNLSNSSNYTFNGVNADMQEEEFFDMFLDTLETTFDNFTSTATEYRTFLPTKLYVGAAFHPADVISFGVLSRTDFFQGDIKQQFTFSTNIYPIRMFSASFSYSIIDGTYQNLGLGIALKLLPLNLYLVTDTGPSIYFWPPDARMVNFKMGMNIMIGNPYGKKKKGKVFDMPLVD